MSQSTDLSAIVSASLCILISGSLSDLSINMQVLAELYHIQPPLVPEDNSPSAGAEPPVASTSQTATDSPQCGQPMQATPRAEAAFPLASTTGGDSFISRQQLGISDTPDAAIGDSGLLEDALTVTAGAASAGTPSQGPTTSPVASGLDADQLSTKSGQASVKALCSQEWKIQHVSLGAIPHGKIVIAYEMENCIMMSVSLRAERCLAMSAQQYYVNAAAGHIPCHAHVPETRQTQSNRWKRCGANKAGEAV